MSVGATTRVDRTVLPPPPSLVAGGRFHLGNFREPLRVVNPLDSGAYGYLPRPLRRLRLKEWQHFGIASDDCYISLAIFDAKVLSLAQVCVYVRSDRRVCFYERKVPPWAAVLPEAEWNSRAEVLRPGFALSIHNHLEAGRYVIRFDVGATMGLPPVAGEFVAHEDLSRVEPMVASLPFDDRRALYSHKAILPAEGELRLGSERLLFDRDASYALVDTHKGFYPYVMTWNWATAGARRTPLGTVGFNLTANQVRDPARYNENCLWVDGRIHLLPPVWFDLDRRDLGRPWRIGDAEGRVRLTFTPEVIRTVDVNAVVLRSRYRGPFGSFTGTIVDDRGEAVPIERQFGMCEDFYLRC